MPIYTTTPTSAATTSGGGSIWTTWVTSSSSTSNTVTWGQWNTASTNYATTSTSAVMTTDCWVTWVDQHGVERRVQVNGASVTYTNQPAAPRPRTAEQIAAEERRAEAHRIQRAEADRIRREADAVSEALLLSVLDEEQRAELVEHGQFHVTGSRSGKRYCITRGHAGNVTLVEEDGRRRRYCAHGRDALPTADHMVMQKLCIEAAEESFLAVANVS